MKCLSRFLALAASGFLYTIVNVYAYAEGPASIDAAPSVKSSESAETAPSATRENPSKTEKTYPPACPLDGEWEFCEAFSDEFNGNILDFDKWFDYNPGWKGREPGWFAKGNVHVADGMLHLTAKAETLPNLPEGYHDFTTAAVQSKERVLYGYFEVRSRPMNSTASSSFWFYAIDPDIWTEIDVYEMSGKSEKHGDIYHTNLHVMKTPEDGAKHTSDGGEWKSPFRFVEDFHTYGLEWNADEVKWYVDGKVVRTSKNVKHHQPLTVNFDSETMPEWFGLPNPADLPSTFSIDYIRCWKAKK